MELHINGQQVDLPEGAQFAVTIQSNDITKPDTVQSSYSNSLTLPYTERNNQVLGNANEVSSLSDTPYRKLEADVLQDGVEIMPRPKAYLLQASEGYELDIFSGSIDLFEKLGDKSIQDLDLTRFDHLWDIPAQSTGSLSTRTDADGYIYDVIDRGKPHEPKTHYPSVFAKTVFEQMLSEAGVKYEYDNPGFGEVILPFSNDKPVHSAKWLADNTMVNFVETGLYLPFPVNNYGILKAVITADVTKMGAPGAKLWAALYRSGVLVEERETIIESTGRYDLQADFRIEPEEDLSTLEIRLRPLSWEANGANVTTGSVSRYYTYDSEAFFKTEWSVALNLPNVKQKDFFKAMLAIYNLMPSFDPYSNTLRLVPMQQLEANKAKAKDWSDKLVSLNNEPTPIQYRFGEFAQRSWFRYKEDETVLTTGDHYFTIDDEQLEAEKDIVKLPFAASEERGGLLYLPMFEQDNEGKWVRKKIQPRIALLNRAYVAGLARSEFAPLRFENLIPQHYTVLQGILDRCKGITPYLLLNATDVQGYDCAIPIWLEQYQAYFYLNQITEYTGEGPTQCQLWRL